MYASDEHAATYRPPILPLPWYLCELHTVCLNMVRVWLTTHTEFTENPAHSLTHDCLVIITENVVSFSLIHTFVVANTAPSLHSFCSSLDHCCCVSISVSLVELQNNFEMYHHKQQLTHFKLKLNNNKSKTSVTLFTMLVNVCGLREVDHSFLLTADRGGLYFITCKRMQMVSPFNNPFTRKTIKTTHCHLALFLQWKRVVVMGI